MGPLPLGAKGIETDEFVVYFGGDKIVFANKSSKDHYTLQVGKHSGILDVHRTWIGDDGASRHETLVAIKQSDLIVVLEAMSHDFVGLGKLLRRLRVGWMVRHKIGFAYGHYPVTEHHIAAVTTKRRQRLIPDLKRFEAAVKVPESPDDIYDQPDGPFALLKNGKHIGIGIKMTEKQKISLRWLNLRDLRKHTIHCGNRVLALLREHAVDPSEYDKHPFLVPRRPTAQPSVPT